VTKAPFGQKTLPLKLPCLAIAGRGLRFPHPKTAALVRSAVVCRRVRLCVATRCPGDPERPTRVFRATRTAVNLRLSQRHQTTTVYEGQTQSKDKYGLSLGHAAAACGKCSTCCGAAHCGSRARHLARGITSDFDRRYYDVRSPDSEGMERKMQNTQDINQTFLPSVFQITPIQQQYLRRAKHANVQHKFLHSAVLELQFANILTYTACSRNAKTTCPCSRFYYLLTWCTYLLYLENSENSENLVGGMFGVCSLSSTRDRWFSVVFLLYIGCDSAGRVHFGAPVVVPPPPARRCS
jgi:hypothetical protein